MSAGEASTRHSMARDCSLSGGSEVTVRYSGNKPATHEVDDKIHFAVDGQAILTREQEVMLKAQPFEQEHGMTANVTASIHVVLARSSLASGGRGNTPANGDDLQPDASREQYELLLKAVQARPSFAAATALPMGIHFMCYLPPPQHRHDEMGAAGGKREEPAARVMGRWAALWEELRADADLEEAEQLKWRTPCQQLLEYAGHSLESEPIRSLAANVGDGGMPTKGWARVPCAPSNNLVCELSRGGWAEDDGGMVAWFHSAVDAEEAVAAAVALADSLLLPSDAKPEPTYASISALRADADWVRITTGAHRVIPSVVPAVYDLSPIRSRARRQPETPASVEIHGSDELSSDGAGAVFVDDSTAPVDVLQGWRGTVAIEELPGGGLHKHVRVMIDVVCVGKWCDRFSGMGGDTQAGNDREWCEVLLSQHVPKGAYIDVDEVKARHDFDILPSLPTSRRAGVGTFEGRSIDVELPSSVSGQHVVNFNFSSWVDMSRRDRGPEGTASIRAEITLPVHLRYPDPGCEKRGEECEGYAWVEVSPPLASIRCGSAGDPVNFFPILPSLPPVGVALRVPHGIAWHRDLVMWGTVAAAALGCLYTVHTLLSLVSVGATRDSDRKRR